MQRCSKRDIFEQYLTTRNFVLIKDQHLSFSLATWEDARSGGESKLSNYIFSGTQRRKIE